MSTNRWRPTLATLALLSLAGQSTAQDIPHIGYIYPAGVQRGTVCELTIGGQHLEGASDVHISGSGVQATVIEHIMPLSRRQITMLRTRLGEMRERRKSGEDAGDEPSPPMKPMGGYDFESMTASELKEVLDGFRDPKKQRNDQIAEMVKLQILFDADAEPGVRELRLNTRLGLSNPLYFQVGQHPELMERETEDDQRATPIRGELPVTLNGQILPGDVDRFRFEARRDQHLVVSVSARELIPFLADAVPGWFQATLGLFDSEGVELAYADDFRFHPDPVLYYEIPADGQYELEIKDSIFRGREDFVYRITLGELPFVTSVFPLGGPAGEPSMVDVAGWNLPDEQLELDWTDVESGVQRVTVSDGARTSNGVPFALDSLAEALESEPNDAPEGAQRIRLPQIVNGRIDRPGDRDVFWIRGRKGEHIVAEVFARRLQSPLDSVLHVLDGKGQELAINDDHEDRAFGLTTHHADSRISFKLPAKGKYYLRLEDAQHQGGPACAYRLKVTRRQPDFELRVVPSSLNVRAGGTVPFTVHALRRDGFSGPINLELIDAPPGFTLDGAQIPKDSGQVRLTLHASPTALSGPTAIALQGHATVKKQEIRHRAVPADDRTQAFITRHLVPAEELLVTTVGEGKSRLEAKLVGKTPVKLPMGGTVQVAFSSPPRKRGGKVIKLVLSNPPDGIAIEDVTFSKNRASIVLSADAETAEPGQRGNLIVDVYMESVAKTKDGKGRVRRAKLGTLPAIPFVIVE